MPWINLRNEYQLKEIVIKSITRIWKEAKEKC